MNSLRDSVGKWVCLQNGNKSRDKPPGSTRYNDDDAIFAFQAACIQKIE